MSRAREHEPTIPAQPFANWLRAKTAEYEKDYGHSSTHKRAHPLGPCERLANELGWGDGDAGVRKLYRYQRQLVERSAERRQVRWMEVAETFARRVVENACHRYSPSLFYDLYPELRHERDVVLEPDAWCPFCSQWVTPIDGLCPFCVCDHGHLFREVGITDDGFACLACLAQEQRERDVITGRARRAA